MSGSDFGPADLLRQRATLYLQIPEARLADLRPFLRLVWTSLMQQLTTSSDLAGGEHHPLLLVLDEAGRTPVAELPDFLVALRSHRISCAVLVQALSQLRAAYGQQASHDPGELLAPRLRPERGYRDGGITSLRGSG